ncbi:fibronectin type III domain-containing protein [Candidatus Dojkabacteria bacterium]|nr:fibronectin type III domain-containing protein [Candidatus Dojkabacteria bacterium]
MKSSKIKNKKNYKTLLLITGIFLLVISIFSIKNFLFVQAHDVKISNVTATSATITWVTTEKNPGLVLVSDHGKFSNNITDYFNSKKYYDQRDIYETSTKTVRNIQSRYTHYVNITNLKPDKTYSFRISNGLTIWNIDNVNQNREWFSIDNTASFEFKTNNIAASSFILPQTISGELRDQEDMGYSDGIVFAKVYAQKSNSEIDTTKTSSIVSTYVNDIGGWVLDYSSASAEVLSTEKEIYISAHIENKKEAPGQFEPEKSGHTSIELFKYDRMQALRKSFLGSFISEVSAAGDSLCCALIITGRKNVYFDYENDGACNSCGKCFPVGSEAGGGTITQVGDVTVSGSNDTEKRNNCESIKRLASEGLPEGSSSGTGSETEGGTFGGTCNAFLDDDKFEVAEINRTEFVSYANRLAGEGSQAAECFNYVVCKSKQYGINPALALSIWVHESAASNYVRFPGVEDMGIHCYGGAGNYPAYPCNQTPKEDIKAQTEMFGLLPHTKCIEGGFDIVKWATGFWTGDCTETSYGTKYYEDLKLQWSSYGKGAFPNWMKKESTAQPNLDCDTDGASSPPPTTTPTTPPTTSPTTPPSSPSSPPSSNPIPTNPSSGTPREMCCAVLLEGEKDFIGKRTTSTSCADAYKTGTTLNGGKVEFGAEIKDKSTTEVMPICCAIKYSGKDNIYFDYENDTFFNKCSDPEAFYIGRAVGAFTVQAVGSEPLRGNTDAEMRANCEGTVRSASEGVPPDTPRGVKINEACEGKKFDQICENGLPSPKEQSASNQYGINTRCVNPNNPPVEDGITNIPISKTQTAIFTKLLQTASAAETLKVKEISGSVVKFPEDGIYNVQIGDYKVTNVPINSDAKYRFYEDKNGKRGYQAKKDTPLAPKSVNEIKIVKVENAFRQELNSGYNFISVNYKRGTSATAPDITAEAVQNIGNIDEIKLTYITSYEDGKWINGVRPRDDEKYGILGNSFLLKPGSGYIIVSNSDLKGASALMLPGDRVTTKVRTKIKEGWNFIGFTGKIDPVSSLKYLIEEKKTHNLDRLNITQWDTKKGLFESVQSFKNQVYGADFTLNNLQGYFVYSDKTFNLK